VWETGDGRVMDRPLLLYGQFVSRRTGTKVQKQVTAQMMPLCSCWTECWESNVSVFCTQSVDRRHSNQSKRTW
jgi:hypothetical protein